MIQLNNDKKYFQASTSVFFEPQVLTQFSDGDVRWCIVCTHCTESLEQAHRCIDRYLDSPPFLMGLKKCLGTRVLKYTKIITEKIIVDSSGVAHE